MSLRIYSILFFFLFSASVFYGQEKVYQLSGVVLNADTEEPVPYARVVSKRNRRIIAANSYGFYSIPVVETDTLYFFALGYKPTVFSVREYLKKYKGNLSKDYIYTLNYMQEDSIRLPEVTIFPYKTPEELKTAILNVPIKKTDPLYVAYKHVDPQLIDRIAHSLPKDAYERYDIAMEVYRQSFHNSIALPTYPLINPVAVYGIIREIVKKSKAQKEEKYKYWGDD